MSELLTIDRLIYALKEENYNTIFFHRKTYIDLLVKLKNEKLLEEQE